MLSIRKIGIIGRTYRHLNRYRQILAVLFKYGFGDLIDLLKIDQYIEVGLRMLSKKHRTRVERHTRAQRIRMAFEELGPTYIKLGQVLSTRPDLIAMEFVDELAKLQDNVPAFPFDRAVDIISRELGEDPRTLFEFVEDTPLASASIGQVHRARLADGEPVAIKIQRPDIRKTIEVDLEIMLHLATLAERHIEEMALHQPVKIVREFARTLEREIDYTMEAANMERFGQKFLGDPTIYIPKVYRDFTTSQVLTMEYVEGIKVSEIDRLEAAGLDRVLINARGADLILRQIFDHGFFHADPHPGNIYVLPNNVVCLLDFGMVGSVHRKIREDFVDLVDSVVHKDEIQTTQALLKLTTWEEEPDIPSLEKDVSDFIGKHLFKPLKEIKIAKLLRHLLEMASLHRLRIPPDIFLMLKAFATVEGVGMKLDPEFDMVAQAAPFIKRVKMDRFHPKRVSSDILGFSADLIRFLQQFPKDMMEITRLIRQRKFFVNMEHQGLQSILHTHDQISNRISFSIIIAALIIGSALIVMSKTPPFFYGISLIGIIGFLFAAVMGIWLIVAIIKKGRL